LSAEQRVFAGMRPRCFYRPRDLAEEVKVGRSSVYRALYSLCAGQVVELVRCGRRRLYVTRQGGLFE
jgi:predicted transcriptional regulator